MKFLCKVFVYIFVMVMPVIAQTQMFQTVKKEDAILLQTGNAKQFCPLCGMDLVMFFKTSHAADNVNGETMQFCSMHCLVEEKEGGKVLNNIRVVGIDTLKFLDVKNAFYVVGSKVKGTMTATSEYAFSTKEAALDFIKENGGVIMSFDEVYKAALEEREKDNAMIAKSQGARALKGEGIAKAMCDFSQLGHVHTVAQAKALIIEKNLCPGINGGDLQTVGLYLVSKDRIAHGNSIDVPSDARCPVCSMFVAKYPKWASKIQADGQKYYFDGVKDMMKFYFSPEKYKAVFKNIEEILVTDYYSLAGIDAKKAFYVYGSNVYGPMGLELIPFANKESASDFAKEHGGTVITFDEITPKIIISLDE